MDFEKAVMKYMGIAFERQNFLYRILGDDHTYNFSMDTGNITFNDELAFSAQVLGTESHYDQTWLWGWANEASQIPDDLLVAANKMKKYGQHYQIDSLTQRKFELNETQNGHYIAMLASGISQANAYYKIDYEGGSLYVLIDDPQFPVDVRDSLQRIALTFPQLIGSVQVSNHKFAFKGHVHAHSLPIQSETDHQIIVKGNHNQTLTAEFDEHKRLTNLTGKLQK